MRIAVITITYNDVTRITQWYELYQEYKNDIKWHIIVDNSSREEYINMLEATFKSSIIIKRNSNGGCTEAYNDGIQYALNNTDCDSIAIIVNDTKVSNNYYPTLYKYLYSDIQLGMVSPTTLIKGTDLVNSSGHTIAKNLSMTRDFHGKKLSSIPKHHYTEMLLGGNNLAKRSFYEKVGLQDENLFMFSDEIDTAIRAKNAGFKLGVTSEVTSMHYHIPYSDNLERPLVSFYLMHRNKLYLAKKHYGEIKKIKVFFSFLFSIFKMILLGIYKKDKIFLKKAKWSMAGVLYGFVGNMKENKYFKK
ncbi:MAG TPA: glycosyltransferase family 2 protein [Bacteroidales bacterium]|nr:glycosyltransferase family 2 protein [Bacteroidales bacterium]